MKIYMPQPNPEKIGGGWSFSKLFFKYNEIHTFDNADTLFIPSASLVDRSIVDEARKRKMKIVLRVDNHLLPSRNRNSGMQKLREYAELADVVIFQSQWAKNYLGRVLGVDGRVILNGIDLDLFHPEPSMQIDDSFLYVRSSRINEKGWELARYWYSQQAMDDPNSLLTIIGRFSSENLDYNFDLFNNEKYQFYGQVRHRELAVFMKTHKYFLYSYFMDACSNTLIEALCSGCQVVDVYGMLHTGGAPEIIQAWLTHGKDYFSYQRMLKEYQEAME